MSSIIHVYCDLCGVEVDKTKETKGFGAISLITLQYNLSGLEVTDKKLMQKDFDICAECCEKLIGYIEKEQKNIPNKKNEIKVEKSKK